MNINKVAKIMTRKEFLKKLDFCNNGKNVMGGYFFEEEVITCPCDLNLEEKCVPDSKCYDCWENAIKNIKFKGENNMENKIDYDREYTIQELFNFKEETKFKADNGISYYIKNDDLFKENGEKTDNTIYRILHMKFKPIKKDRKVSFEEAIQAYNVYKTIKCIWLDDIYEFGESKESKLTNIDEDRLLNLILEGKWYVKEG